MVLLRNFLAAGDATCSIYWTWHFDLLVLDLFVNPETLFYFISTYILDDDEVYTSVATLGKRRHLPLS